MGSVVEFSPQTSRHIERLTYDPDTQKLSIRFKNESEQTFLGVPASVVAGMTRAPSAGKYFHNVIKVHYRREEKE